jgi:transposase
VWVTIIRVLITESAAQAALMGASAVFALLIEIYYLPPYSPNLNPIERLWLFFHKKILYDKYYETFKEFKTATLEFFQNIKHYDKELKKLLTDSFQTLPAEICKPG